MTLFLLFVAGALLCNCIPHLANGVSGRAFPTPFAHPPGVGQSRPVVNVAWGSANLVLGVLLVWRRAEVASEGPGLAAIGVGFVLAGLALGWHFGRVRGARG